MLDPALVSAGFLALAAALEGAGGGSDHDALERIALPRPAHSGRRSFEEILAARRSVRAFAPAPLTVDQIAQLLWAAQGIMNLEGDRTAPSAGALFPLEAYVALAQGFYHYHPRRHQLERRIAGDVREDLFQAALLQEAVRLAPAVFVLAGVPERSAIKYGSVRALRYVAMEAGHAAQNLLLEAVALGLASVPIGAFEDAKVRRILDLPDEQDPLYLLPVGRRGADSS